MAKITQNAQALKGKLATEIHNREPDGSTLEGWVDYLNQNIVSIPSETPGRVHFSEYAID